jgi:DNA polymerase III alpha subunit
VFAPRKTCQPSLIFASKAKTFHCETLHDASSKLEGSLFAHKYETWLKSLAQDKHSSVFVRSVVSKEKKFYNVNACCEETHSLSDHLMGKTEQRQSG